MQELFAAKVHFLKFFSVSDKPWLDKLKIITAARLTSFSEFFHRYSEGKIPPKKDKYPVLRTNSKPQQLIKRTKFSSFIASLVLCKPSRGTYGNGLNRGTTSRTSKSTNRSSLKPFVRNPNLSILVRRVRCCLRKDFQRTKIWRQIVEDEQVYKIYLGIEYYTWGTLATLL